MEMEMEFPRFNAKILIYFSKKIIYGNDFTKQHSETVLV